MRTQNQTLARTHQSESLHSDEPWRPHRGRPVRRHVARLAAAPTLVVLIGGLVVALPATQAAASTDALSTVSRFGDSVFLTAAAGTANDVIIFFDENDEMTIIDDAGIQEIAGDGCSVFFGDTAKCGTGVTQAAAVLSDQADEVRAEAPIPTSIDTGSGDDIVFAGRVVGGDSEVEYFGGAGFDTVSYVNADRFVTVSLDGTGGDGRPDDNDNVFDDVERVIGSRFPDTLIGNDAVANILDGLSGPDTLSGLGGDDTFIQSEFADGADDISGGAGVDQVLYSQRRAGITVDLDGVADDGAAGEGDNIRGDVENVSTGSGDDILTGNGAINAFESGTGADRLSGKGGPDALSADLESDDDPGADVILGGGGNDTIGAADDVLDDIRCGSGRGDTAFIDSGLDKVRGCEFIGSE